MVERPSGKIKFNREGQKQYAMAILESSKKGVSFPKMLHV